MASGTERQGGAERAQGPERGRRTGLRVVALLVIVGAIFGVLAYRNLVLSEKELTRDLAAMKRQGAALDVDGCVDAVIAWHDHCGAMKSLCDQMVPRFMDACLVAGDRVAYCAALGERSRDTRFGFQECKARAGDRDDKKACAVIYRVIDGHCADVRSSS